MTREQIYEDLRATMVELFELEPESITPSATLRDDLDLDSIDAIDMAARLHKLTGRKLDMSSLKKLVTVGDVVDLVEEHLRAG